MVWTQFQEFAQSTGAIFLATLVLWALLAGIIYWAIASGTTSMGEEVKYRVVEDDKPISR